MIAFRIDREKRRGEALSGRGAELYGGRWNLPGTPAVYLASYRSLAMLEMLVHLDLRVQLPADRILIQVEIPDRFVESIEVKELGDNWNAFPYHIDSQKIFGEFVVKRGNALALLVPSAMVPEENNLILNPGSTHFDLVKVMNVRPLIIDDRWQF